MFREKGTTDENRRDARRASHQMKARNSESHDKTTHRWLTFDQPVAYDNLRTVVALEGLRTVIYSLTALT